MRRFHPRGLGFGLTLVAMLFGALLVMHDRAWPHAATSGVEVVDPAPSC